METLIQTLYIASICYMAVAYIYFFKQLILDWKQLNKQGIIVVSLICLIAPIMFIVLLPLIIRHEIQEARYAR